MGDKDMMINHSLNVNDNTKPKVRHGSGRHGEDKDPGSFRNRSDSWASEADTSDILSDFDLRHAYQNAIDCLKQCETIITGLQDQLTTKDAQIANLQRRPLERIINTLQDQLSAKNQELTSKDEQIAKLLELINEDQLGSAKDEQIASLEERIIQMSVELASAKAVEDEHRLLKRRLSNASDDNFSSRSSAETQDTLQLPNVVSKRGGSISSASNSHNEEVVNTTAATASARSRVFGRHRRATTDEQTWRNLNLPLSKKFGKQERRASTGDSSPTLQDHSWHCTNVLTKEMDGANVNSSSAALPHNSWHCRKYLTKEDYKATTSATSTATGYQPTSQRRRSRSSSRAAALDQPIPTSPHQRRRSSRSDHSRRSDLSSSLPAGSHHDAGADEFHVSTGSLNVDFGPLDQSENRSCASREPSLNEEQAIDALLNDTSSKQSSNSVGRFLRNLSSSMVFDDAIADDLQSVERMVDKDYKISDIDDDSVDAAAAVEARKKRGNSDGCIDAINSSSNSHTTSRAQARRRPRNHNRRASMDSANNNIERSNPRHSMNNIGRMLRRTFSQNMLCDATDANSDVHSKPADGNDRPNGAPARVQTTNQYIENALNNRKNRQRRRATRQRTGVDGFLISSLKSSSSTIPGVVFPSTFEDVIDKGCLELRDSLKKEEAAA